MASAVRLTSRGRGTPFALIVMATDIADSVAAAGGLIYDSARAGWTVRVYVENLGDERPLRILGVNAHAIPDAFDFEPEWPDAVYLALSVYNRHRHVRRMVADAVRRQHADIAVWTDDNQSEAGPEAAAQHRLSSAARAFKRHAMTAAGRPPQVRPVEPFLAR